MLLSRSGFVAVALVLATASTGLACTLDSECDDANAATVDTCKLAVCDHASVIAGKRLTVRAGATNALRTAVKGLTIGTISVHNPPFLQTLGDPTIHGASIRVKAASGEFDATYALPAANWTYLQDPTLNRGYKYRDRFLASGPFKTVTVKDQQVQLMKFYGKGTALALTLAQDPQQV